MKGLIVVPIIIGSALLLAGGALFGVAVYKSSKNSTLETKEYKEEDLGAFNKIDVDLTIADLYFKKGDAVKVVVDETKYDVHDVNVSDNTLVIKGKNTRKWYEHIFNWNWFDRVQVTVYMPEGDYDSLKVKSSTGNIVVPEDFTFTSFDAKASTGNITSRAKVTNNVDIKVSTGNVSLESVAAKNITVESSTGNIVLKNNTVSEKISIDSDTGNIRLDNVTCADYYSHADTGNVNFVNTTVTNKIEIKNGTGYVKMTSSDAEALEIKTSTGNVNLELLTPKIVYADTKTGSKNVPTSTVGGLCNITTSTGSIKVTFLS
ncbi:MAG: DUF4097 family beta strand repeat protein [Bacilli bacterium]|nr:DUF4097 family beta strand repeat protein [Bacilli bacterium]